MPQGSPDRSPRPSKERVKRDGPPPQPPPVSDTPIESPDTWGGEGGAGAYPGSPTISTPERDRRDADED
jgi:hypothetical protein